MTRRGLIALLQTKLSWRQVGENNGPSRVYLTAGPAPTDTVAPDAQGNPQTFDAVMYLDVDQQLKLLRKDGTISQL